MLRKDFVGSFRRGKDIRVLYYSAGSGKGKPQFLFGEASRRNVKGPAKASPCYLLTH